MRNTRKTDLRKGFGSEAALITMVVCLAFGVIVLTVTAFVTSNVANSVDWLSDKRLLDVIGEDFAKNPKGFYSGNYAPFYSLSVSSDNGMDTLEVYELDSILEIAQTFITSPMAFSVDDNSGKGYVVTRTIADGSVTLRIIGGDLLIRLELTAYPESDGNGGYVSDDNGYVYEVGDIWSWQTRETDGDGMTVATHTGTEREWRAARMQKRLTVSVSSDGITEWRYGGDR